MAREQPLASCRWKRVMLRVFNEGTGTEVSGHTCRVRESAAIGEGPVSHGLPSWGTSRKAS